MKQVFLIAWLIGSSTISAGETTRLEAVTARNCFERTAPTDLAPPCLGQMSTACVTQDGRDILEVASCIDGETAEWDVLLNVTYRDLLDHLRRDAVEGEGVDHALVDAQRAWIAYRDAECALTYARSNDRTLSPIGRANCLLVFTARRALELRDMKGL
jgi:uncharacterized protein YecT (DUF1311 family)